MGSALILLLALALDALVGDPRALWSRYPHPVAMAGHVVTWVEASFNNGKQARARGFVFIAVVSVLMALFGLVLGALPDFGLLELLIVAVLLAQNSLVKHAFDVACGLRIHIEQGRTSVAELVGRDVSTLDESGVVRATVESLAENLSDAVVAPAFWYLVAGLPGILIYKFINTADSMIGHRTDRYREFGWAAARLDDALNWIPARITGLLIALAHGSMAAISTMFRDGRKHRSLNAGWPEAAMAAVLGIAVSGPRTYDGETIDYPFVNQDGRKTLTPADIDACIKACWKTFTVLCALVLFVWLVI